MLKNWQLYSDQIAFFDIFDEDELCWIKPSYKRQQYQIEKGKSVS